MANSLVEMQHHQSQLILVRIGFAHKIQQLKPTKNVINGSCLQEMRKTVFGMAQVDAYLLKIAHNSKALLKLVPNSQLWMDHAVVVVMQYLHALPMIV